MDEIINKVAKSQLISLDLKEYYHKGTHVIFDVKSTLYKGLMLREKNFREFLKENDWSVYQDKNVGLICSADAVIPTWTYMLLVTKLKGYANSVTYGDDNAIEKALIDQAIEKCLANNDFHGKKVVIKGCGDIVNIEYAYTTITEKLLTQVSSLMYGEPCSTVPIFKHKK